MVKKTVAAASSDEPAASESSVLLPRKSKKKVAAASGGEPAASEASPATAPDSEATPPSLSKTSAKKGPPPADYSCAACNEKGHWVFDCVKRVRKFQKKKRPKTDAGGIKKRPKINF